MRSDADIRNDGIQAGVFLAAERVFMNSPDVAHVVMQPNTAVTIGFTDYGAARGKNALIIGSSTTNSGETVFILGNLPGNKYDLKRPIVVTMRPEGDSEWIATFPEAELSRSGDTPQEALGWLESSMIELYELLRREKKLGPL